MSHMNLILSRYHQLKINGKLLTIIIRARASSSFKFNKFIETTYYTPRRRSASSRMRILRGNWGPVIVPVLGGW